MSVLTTSALVQWLEQKPLCKEGSSMGEDIFIPHEYDVFAGLDVSKKSIAATFTNQQGFIRSLQMPHKTNHLLNHVRKHFAGQKIAFVYEAGPTGYGLYDGLAAEGYRCLIAAPSMIPRAPGKRVKTNRLDSRALSESLRGGQLKSIHVPSVVYRELRHLTQLRDTMVRQAAGHKQRIKSLLLFEGIEFPPAAPGRQWTLKVKAELRKLRCSRTVRFKLDELLDSLEFSEKQVVRSTKEIRRFCKEENVRQLGSFLGVVPTEDSTGDTVDRGSITHSGDGRLRSKLIQAAWSAIRQDPELREFYRSVCRRNGPGKGPRIAIVAVARKLSTRVYAVLKNQRSYIVREQVHSAPLTQEETSPQGTPRRCAEPGETENS
jgi:transposase